MPREHLERLLQTLELDCIRQVKQAYEAGILAGLQLAVMRVNESIQERTDATPL